MQMQRRTNRREFDEHYVKGRHLNLNDLKQEAQHLENQYLYKENIPNSPKPEFHATRLKHDTDQDGLRGISSDGGFRVPYEASDDPHEGVLLWWSLAVDHKEVKSAETRLLKKKFPNLTEDEAAMHPSFLYKFTSSPAFSEKSRLGSYRFTFNLEEVLEAYRQQFCSGHQPVMRIYETILHKQEVQHTVLVHSPANQELFSEFPLLTDDPNAVCIYKDGRFIWRPYAMSETHQYELVERPDIKRMDANICRKQFYIWDNVAVALHVDKQVLKFDADQLRENLKFCHRGKPVIGTFDSFKDAENQVADLWPDCEYPLEEECSLQQRFTDLRLALVGRIRSGKSSSGNIILGRDAFSTGKAAAGNVLCCLQNEKVFDWEVTIVDTPGFSETPKVKTEISECVNLLYPRPHAFLLVIKVGTRTARQQNAVRQMEEIFGENVWSNTFIVLIYNNQSEFVLDRTKTELQRILYGRVEDRYYVLKRNSSNDQRVWDLLDAVAKMVVTYGGQVFPPQGLGGRGNRPTRRRGRSSSIRQPSVRRSPPTTLILGDAIIRNIPFEEAEIRSVSGATVSITQKILQDLLPSLPSIQTVVIHVGGADIVHQQLKVTKNDFIKLFYFLKQRGKDVFISGPIPALNRSIFRFSKTLSLHTLLQETCKEHSIEYIDNFNVFWNRWYLFAPNGVYLNKRGSQKLAANMKRTMWSNGRG